MWRLTGKMFWVPFVIVVLQLLFSAGLRAERRGESLHLKEGEEMTWNSRRGVLTASGNVRARWGDRHITADHVYYHEQDELLVIRGNARVILDGESQVAGEYIRINMATDQIETEELAGEFQPWYLRAGRVEGTIDTHLVGRSASLTTCDLEDPHYQIRASEFHLYPGDMLIAYNIVAWFGRVPAIYLPWMAVDLKGRFSRWSISPGYSSHDGMMLDMGYRYLMDRDGQPVTGTIYTDLREYTGHGFGADVEYDKEDQHVYLYYFHSRRRPLLYDEEEEEEVRADDKRDLWKFRSTVDYSFDGLPWRLHGEVDWADYARFNREFQRTLATRTQEERFMKGSLIRRDNSSLFRVEAERQDRLRADVEDYRQESGHLPRIRYQLFPVSLDFLPGGFYYRLEGQAAKKYETNSSGETFRPWEGWVDNSLIRSVPWSRSFSQSYRLGYEQRYREKEEDSSESSESTGAGSLRVRNSFRPFPGMNLDLNYNLKERINRRDQVELQLLGENLGLESSGRLEHNLDLTLNWRRGDGYAQLRSGYDLRRLKNADISSDSRVYPVRLNFSFPLGNYWSWNQFAAYNFQEDRIDQLNTDWEFSISRQFQTSLSWHYNRREEEDFSRLGHGFNWTPRHDRWRFRSDLVYDIEKEQLDETRLKVYRQLHCWEMRVMYREIKDRDRQVWLAFNLVDYPSRALGFERNIGRDGYDLTEGTWEEIVE